MASGSYGAGAFRAKEWSFVGVRISSLKTYDRKGQLLYMLSHSTFAVLATATIHSQSYANTILACIEGSQCEPMSVE